MRLRKRLFTPILAFLLLFALVPAAKAQTGSFDRDAGAAELPYSGEYRVRINGGYVAEHTERVGDTDCLRVDLFLEGATDARPLSSISFKLLYDPAQLTYVKAKSLSANGVMSYLNPGVAGMIQYAFISTNGSVIPGTTPLLTLWFTLAEGLAPGTQIRFAFGEAIRADSVDLTDYSTQKCTVGAVLRPFGIGPIYGDANCDCDVGAADAALVLRALVGLDSLSGQGLLNAKVDGAAALSVQDAALILRYIVKLIDRFPVQE